MGGRVGGTHRLTLARLRFLCSTPDGVGHRKRTPGRGVNKQHSIFYVWRGRCQCATSIYYYSYIYRASRGISGVGVTITLLCPRSMPA